MFVRCHLKVEKLKKGTFTAAHECELVGTKTLKNHASVFLKFHLLGYKCIFHFFADQFQMHGVKFSVFRM